MFHVLEARTNRAVLLRLANATAVIGGGQPVPVLFDAEFSIGNVGVVGMGAADPQLWISSIDAPPELADTVILVNGAAWRVALRKPDGAQVDGLTLLILEKP
jgi:hypothetical protein